MVRALPIRRQLARMLLVPLLVLASWTSTRLYHCRHEGTIRARCCCAGAEVGPRTADVSLEAGPCCDVQTIEAETSPATSTSSRIEIALVSTWTTADVVAPLRSPAGRIARIPAAPPTGPPILLAKQSLLI